MSKTPIWKSIIEALSDEIAAGHYQPADKLPTEAALAARFGVNRHTVRRALADMADGGLIISRRGSGVFVAAKPTTYPIGRRVRFHQNLAASGQAGTKRNLHLETREADEAERQALDLKPNELVHVFEGLSLADGAPIALFRSRFSARRFPQLLEFLHKNASVSAALLAAGVADFTRASTRLTAKRATATQALNLHIREGDPILRTISINIDEQGSPVEYGHTWFAGDRVTLTVEPD